MDFDSATFSDITDELIATSYLDDKKRIYFRDKALESDYRLLEKKLPGRTVNLGSRTADEQQWIVSATSDVEPGETFVFDRKTKQLTSQYKIREKLPREALSPMTPVRYTSTDGLEIPAYLTVPKGTSGKNMPAIVVPHGGPWARDDWGYDGIAQFLSNRGYVVLQPNFRGLDRLRQEVPQRRQQTVGRPDAGRPHVGREVPRRQGHRRPQARRHPGRLLRRLCHAGRPRIHAGRVRRRRLDRRTVEHHHAARLDSAVLGSHPHGFQRATGQPGDA